MPLRKLLVAVSALCAGLVLGACGSMEMPTKKVDYKSTTRLPSLEIPPDLARPGSDDRFVLPENPKGSATLSELNKQRVSRPQSGSGGVLPKIDDVRLERAGTQRWLVVKGNPEQLWPLVREFWQESGFIVNLEIPEAGVMETEWTENRAKIPESGLRGFIGRVVDGLYSTSERDKYRTRLERGSEPGTTEIYISHRGMEEVYITEGKDQLRWQPRKPDPELEAEFLRRLMVRFGTDNERAKTKIASVAKVEPQARLDRGGALALTDPFDQAWRRVGLALDRVGFTVEDRDRSKGLYFVRYIDPDADVRSKKETGWLARLNPFSGSPSPVSKEQYRIQIRDTAGGTEVQVLDKEGKRDASVTANRILTLLHDQLR